MSKYTLAIIKPDAVDNAGGIIAMYEKAGFKVRAMRKMNLTTAQAGAFYAVHSERSFYGALVEYMTSGSVVPVALEKENAVADYRELIGATNPSDAAEGTVRAIYGKSIEANAVHGSDSDENAAIETAFFFPGCDLV
jgi:nucleoside-diphosphate kinase